VLEVVKPAGKVTVTVLPDFNVPLDDVVNPMVQVEAVLATSDVGAVPVKVTVDSDEAPASAKLHRAVTIIVVRTRRRATRAPCVRFTASP
jgi:hypothetical protein